MSFTCQGCQAPQKARVVPHQVVREEREVVYSTHKRDLSGDLVPATTHGREIHKELSLCGACAGVPVRKEEIMSPFGITGFGITKLIDPKDHRRRCKENVEDCKLCQNYVKMAYGLPPHLASLALENPKAPILGVSLAALAFSTMQDKTTFNTRRGAEDVKATYTIMGPYAKRGGCL